jgi:hypothetical protein
MPINIAGTTLDTLQIKYRNELNTIDSGLILYLDAGITSSYSGTGNVWYNFMGNGIDGNLINGPSYSSNNSGIIRFDGVDDYIDFGNTAASFSPNNITVSSFSQISAVVSKNNLLSLNGQINFFLPGNRLGNTYLLYWDSVSLWRNGNTLTWSNNTWYNFAWTINGTELKFYVNGVLDGTVSLAANITPSGNLRVGLANAGEYATGNISSVYVYNRTLTQTEIQQNFNSARKRFNI